MHKTPKIYTMIFCLGVLVFVMIMIFVRTLSYDVLVKKFHIDHPILHVIFFDNKGLRSSERETSRRENNLGIDWKDRYPFSNMEKDDDYVLVRTLLTTINKVKTKVYEKENKLIKQINERLPLYVAAVEQGRRYEELIGWNIINPEWEIAFLPDGYLTSALKRNNNMKEYIDSVSFLDKHTKEMGGELLFVQAPFKVCKYGDSDINDKFDFSNANADDLIAGLSKNGIRYIDLRDEARSDFGVDQYHELFFRTDHHWKPETGLWAASVIAHTLNSKYGFHIDLNLFHEEQYEIKVFQRWFLGSLGKKLTLSRVEPEDCSYMLPRFPHEIHYEIPSLGINATGTFEITYDPYQFSSIDYYEKTLYEGYNYSDNPVIRFHNNQVIDGKRILIIKDSFANVIVPFLSLGVENLCVIDTRMFTGSLLRFTDEYRPDIVLIIANPSSYERPIDWESHTSFFDFR